MIFLPAIAGMCLSGKRQRGCGPPVSAALGNFASLDVDSCLRDLCGSFAENCGDLQDDDSAQKNCAEIHQNRGS